MTQKNYTKTNRVLEKALHYHEVYAVIQTFSAASVEQTHLALKIRFD